MVWTRATCTGTSGIWSLPCEAQSNPPEDDVRRIQKDRNHTGAETYFPEFCVMIDSSEQQIPRPKKNKKKRQTHYSGKKGMHTVKNQYTDQSNVYRDIRYMEPAVRGSIPIPQKMIYAESKKIGTIQELERYFPEFCVMIDSSEQQIPRPKKNKKKRQTHYSGKKGMHTVKNQYTR